MSDHPPQRIPLTLWKKGHFRQLWAEPGKTLREMLLAQGETPYQGPFRQLNCGGLGICGSCKVEVKENGEWWERRSCQLRCFHPIEIQVE